MRAVTRKWGTLILATLGTMMVVALPGMAQEAFEPEGEFPKASCYVHHRQEGFRSVDLAPTPLAQLERDAPFQFDVTVTNPWLHEVRELFAYVNISDAPAVRFPGEKLPVIDIIKGTLPAKAGTHSVTTHTFDVESNATEFIVTLEGAPGLAGPMDLPDDFDLTLTSPAGRLFFAGPDPRTDDPVQDAMATPTAVETLRIDVANLTFAGPGTWTLEVAYRGAQPEGAYQLHVGAFYNLSRSPALYLPGPALKPGESHTFTFELLAHDAADLQALRYGAVSISYYDHSDRNTEDATKYDKWSTRFVTLGDEETVGTFSAAPIRVDTSGPIVRRWAASLGFAGSFLLVPSLVFGGTFGRESVQWLNRAMGSPRRRVLFHNSVSFWLLAVSILHVGLFLYEAFWNWSHGLVWGGLSLAAMVGLGVTGATQRRFVAKWGFPRWRFVHFAMAILVIVFVLGHMVADGSHFSWARAWFSA